MKVSLERTFRVRHYECDAYETVYYTNYLRYIQETAMDASAALGFDAEWYAAHGTSWLVRETDITFLRPLRYGDSVCVKTWVENYRQAVSRRAYELRLADSGDPVARAATDWVYLDTAKGKPLRIPDEFKRRLLPEGAPPDTARWERFPDATAPEQGVFRQRRRVEWRDIDPAQHVNNSVYLAYAEDAAVEASVVLGWTPARMREAGFFIVISGLRIEYKVPAVLGDDLVVATWLANLDANDGVRHFTITRVSDGILLARAMATLGCVDVANGERIPFHEKYRVALQS